MPKVANRVDPPRVPPGLDSPHWLILDVWAWSLHRITDQRAGSCGIGTIKPSFFLLPIKTGELLGFPVWASCEKRSIAIGNWKDDEWPPERITQYYWPGTWAQDGSWGYQTPIYMVS